MKSKIISVKKFLFAILMLCACMYCQAQKKIGLGADGVTLSANSVCMGDSLTYSIHVKNKGLIAITIDSVRLMGNFVTSGAGIQPIETKTITTTVLQPGDSLFMQFADNVNGPEYLSGNNIIVIWPIVPAVPTIDSGTINLQVDSCAINGIDGGQENSSYIYFDNSTAQLFFFSEAEITSAEIFDVNGKLIHRCSPAFSTEQIPKLATGIYFVQAQFINGRRTVFRFVRHE